MKFALLSVAAALAAVLLWMVCEKPDDWSTSKERAVEERRIRAERERRNNDQKAAARREAEAAQMAKTTEKVLQSIRPQGPGAGTSESNVPGTINNEISIDAWAKKFREMAIADPASALKAIISEVPLSLRSSVAEALLADVGRINLKAVPILLNAISDMGKRASLLSQVTFDWGQRDPRGLFDLALRELKGRERNQVLVNAIRGTTASRNFEMGKQLLAEMPFSNERLDALADLSWTYGNFNLDGAIAWATKLEIPEDRARALTSLADQVAKLKGLAGIEQALGVVNDYSTRSRYIQAAAPLLQNEGGQTINEWINRFSPREQDELITHLMRTAPVENLMELSGYVSTMPTKHGQQVAAAELASRLLQSSPESAADWVLRLPSEYRHAGIVGLVNTWYGTDSDQLSAWVSQLPRGNDRDAVLGQLVSLTKSSDPEGARALAAQITDQKKRKSLEAGLQR